MKRYQIIRIGPCHPSKADIKTKQCGDRRRRCSENIFSHSDGNFPEALKFLSIYDPTMQQHLSNVQAKQCRVQITKTIVIAIEQCRAWAIIVPVARIVHINGTVSEHLLAIQNANNTTAENIFDLLFCTLQSKDVSFWLHRHMMEHLT